MTDNITELKYYNYEYRDPRDNTPIWVGKGSGLRAYDHLDPKKEKVSSPGLTAAIAELRALGLEAVIQIVEYFAVGAEAYAAERGRIAQYGRRSSGTGPLYNRKPGGEVPKKRTYRFGVDPKPPPTYRPMKVLTDRIIHKLKPAGPDKRYVIPDALVPGLGVCVTDSGHRTYVLGACYPGSHYERREIGEVDAVSLDAARDTARAWLAEIEAEYTVWSK